MADLTDREILSAMPVPGGSGVMTYVVANCIRMAHRRHNGTLDTARVLRRLKALEKRDIVERVPSSYARQICWRVKEATCAVGGMLRHGAMCGSVIGGGKLCGHNGPCEHRRVVTPNAEVSGRASEAGDGRA